MKPNKVGGGQIWEQDDFPNFSIYVILLGGSPIRFAFIDNPTYHRGCMVRSNVDGKWEYTPRQAAAYLKHCKYTYKGQFRDLYINECYGER